MKFNANLATKNTAPVVLDEVIVTFDDPNLQAVHKAKQQLEEFIKTLEVKTKVTTRRVHTRRAVSKQG